MGYKLSPDFGDGTQGGPYDKGGSKKPRPQNYSGKYTFNIPGSLSRPQDNGAEHPGIAPKQDFRRELPPATKAGTR